MGSKPADRANDSNRIVENQLHQKLGDIEKETGSNVLTFRADLLYGSEDALRHVVENTRDRNQNDSLKVILETTGGYVEVVQRMVDTLRHHYKIVEFIVPNYAMSAGTVFAMSGDAIHMDYYSIMGPIDPQIERADGGGLVPALGYLVQYERLIEKSRIGKLTTAELTFLVQKFDPAELYRYEQERELSISLLKDWLVRYKFKNWKRTRTRKKRVTLQMRTRRASEIAKKLNDTNHWHSHSRGLSMEVLRRELKLEILDFGEDPGLNRKIKEYYSLLTDYMGRRSHGDVIHSGDLYFPVLYGG